MSKRGVGEASKAQPWAACRNASPVCHLPPLLRLAQQQALPKTKPPSPASASAMPLPPREVTTTTTKRAEVTGVDMGT